eukprot:2673245-Rhodomonas_salina.4
MASSFAMDASSFQMWFAFAWTRRHAQPVRNLHLTALTFLEVEPDAVDDMWAGQTLGLIRPDLPLALRRRPTWTYAELEQESSWGVAKLPRRLGDVELHLKQCRDLLVAAVDPARRGRRAYAAERVQSHPCAAAIC